MIAVNAAPISMPASGFWKVVISFRKAGDDCSGAIASPIISMPINSTPSPAKMELICFTLSFLENNMTATLINAIKGAIAPISSAISCPVIVVPILAPIITHTAWLKFIRPELTKPTTMTVVAEEDWMTAVMAAPARTPLKRLEVSFSRIVFILLPAAVSRPVLIICMPYKNRASPPSSIKRSFISIVFYSPLYKIAGFIQRRTLFSICLVNDPNLEHENHRSQEAACRVKKTTVLCGKPQEVRNPAACVQDRKTQHQGASSSERRLFLRTRIYA